MNFNFAQIPAFHQETNLANIIIDTPKGSRNKFKFDAEKKLFKLKHILPAGAVFPFDFGFLPNTLTEDGDPLDILILLEAPAFVGCLIETRILGVLEAEQTDKNGQTERNDRLIGVFAEDKRYEKTEDLRDLPPELLQEIEHFFRSYNEIREIRFKVLASSGAKKALQIIQKSVKLAEKSKQPNRK